VEKAKGRVKAGEGTLIGNAGEHYVVAELLRRGIVAALAPRNAPAMRDVVAWINMLAVAGLAKAPQRTDCRI
jgi:hypothetical protein